MEAQEFFQTSFLPQFPSSPSDNNLATTNVNGGGGSDHFIVEDLFDFSNEDDAAIGDPAFDSPPAISDNSPPLETNENSNFFMENSCQNSVDEPFSGELSVPYDDLAELEWLSKFDEESFSSEDLQKLELISGLKASNDAASKTNEESNPLHPPQVSVPAKARSKLPRGPPCNWTSRLLVLSPPTITTTTTASSHSDIIAPPKKPSPRKRDHGNDEGRKCLHCATDKTPQWRTGPLGPKTLCNACGVRYKSGRLVPEYRPAASPTFVLTKHSNSHRKVQELRRQKEMMKVHQHQMLQLQVQHHHNIMFDGPSNGDDYLIHQHVGPDFTHLM
ncbi:unnamed protein product [Vicia faba]|uniref:GATA transcription factor n=1 Tax=Vicia faba TaxID=3906 RepID=A0AAV0ZMR6_VICFA|nr:unnamed protein product [Vicia faba]